MKVAINGFGRIGKNLTRQLIEKNFLEGNQELELVAVNDLGSIETNAFVSMLPKSLTATNSSS